MKIDNSSAYESTGWSWSNAGEPVDTRLGTTFLVSNYHGLYGVVASGLLLLQTDNWNVAHDYIVVLKKEG
jgi:hypothetical protein